MENTTARLGAAALLAGITLLGAPASAENMSAKDPADASASLYDIRSVKVSHQTKKLVVRVGVTDLVTETDGGPASMSLFVDTDRTRPGPEFRLGTGLQSGSDYQLVKMKKWKVQGSPLSCGHRLVLDEARDQVKFRINSGCLRRPVSVRVGVRMVDAYDASHPVTDWFKGRRAWTRWVDRG